MRIVLELKLGFLHLSLAMATCQPSEPPRIHLVPAPPTAADAPAAALSGEDEGVEGPNDTCGEGRVARPARLDADPTSVVAVKAAAPAVAL